MKFSQNSHHCNRLCKSHLFQFVNRIDTNNKKFCVNLDSYVFFVKFYHYQIHRKDRLTRLYDYHEYSLTFPIVYQSYPIARVYCSIVRKSYFIIISCLNHILLFTLLKNNVAGTVAVKISSNIDFPAMIYFPWRLSLKDI